VVDTVALPVPEAGSRAAGGEERLQARYRARILVAEDNVVNQKLIRLMLEEFGAAADIARNGLEAIEKYERERYDLVFLDINMPVYDGLEAAKMILEFEARESLVHVPLVALTAKAMKGDRESLLASGFDDYLSKPLSLDALGGVMERYLQGLKETGPPPVKEEQGPAPAGASYDLGKTATILGIPPATLKEIIKEFFASTGDYVGAISGAVASGDVKRMADSAHRLKGLAANLQFTGLAALCESMETGTRRDYKVMLDEIKNAIIMLDGELKPMLEH